VNSADSFCFATQVDSINYTIALVGSFTQNEIFSKEFALTSVKLVAFTTVPGRINVHYSLTSTPNQTALQASYQVSFYRRNAQKSGDSLKSVSVYDDLT
jgi:hypothetical protein